MSDTALINRCMDILRESVGVVNAEKFVYIMRTDAFDYTEWQREYFDTIAPDELDALYRIKRSQQTLQNLSTMKSILKGI